MGSPTQLQLVRPERGGGRALRLRIWLAGVVWLPVLAANLVAIGLGLGLPFVDELLGDQPLLPIALSSVEEILGALAAGMITFTGVVFAAVLVAAQVQTTSYSPRLAARLRRDPVVVAALTLPTATASYALFALGAIGREADRSGDDIASALTVAVALLLAFVTFGVFIALVQRAFDSTQIGGIFRGIMRRTQQVIEDVHPVEHGSATLPARTAGEPEIDVTHSGPPGVLASIDRGALLRLARESGAFVEVVPLVGHYISTGTVVLRLRGAGQAPRDELTRRVLILARQRTIDQDPAFGMRMLVDIAIRALSPAVNDPTTAVQALDCIETLLIELHRRRPASTLVADVDGTLRGLFRAPAWEQYLELGLMEIRHYGTGSIQVARRLRAVYERLGGITTGPARARVELERRLLDEALGSVYPDAAEREIAGRPDRLGLGSAA